MRLGHNVAEGTHHLIVYDDVTVGDDLKFFWCRLLVDI